jgi:hypothetical protein
MDGVPTGLAATRLINRLVRYGMSQDAARLSLQAVLDEALAGQRRQLLGTSDEPSALARDAAAYHWLRDEITDSMPDQDAWDGDGAEEHLLAGYVNHLAESHGPCQRCLSVPLGMGIDVDQARARLASVHVIRQRSGSDDDDMA